jgi:hypothetical protein
MPFSLAVTEIIKRRLFRAREHLESCTLETVAPHLESILEMTYEYNRALGLPAVRHTEGAKPEEHLEDALMNLTTVIDFDLTQVTLYTATEDAAVNAAQEMMAGIQTIPLPETPKR